MKVLSVVSGCTIAVSILTSAFGGEGFSSGKDVLPKVPIEEPIDYRLQALNPIADVRSFGFEDYYLTEIQGYSDDANIFSARYSEPFSFAGHDWLFKARLPIVTMPEFGGGTETGLGDLILNTSYLFDTHDPNVSFGLGPLLILPTATDARLLGSEKWSAGLSNTYFNGAREDVQFGYTLSWAQSFAGDSGREYFNVGSFQPFVFWQLGDGWYTGTAPTWVYNFQDDSYVVPLGIRLGKVLETEMGTTNIFVEPQYSVFRRGTVPEWTIFAGVNIQFW